MRCDFNPVEVIRQELFAGSSFEVPSEILSYLDLVKTVSNIMFVFYIVAICTAFETFFLLIFTVRWWTSVMAGIAGFCTAISSGVATAMFQIIVQKLDGAIPELNMSHHSGRECLHVLGWLRFWP